jgi:hypothetical protein
MMRTLRRATETRDTAACPVVNVVVQVGGVIENPVNVLGYNFSLIRGPS